MKFLRRLYLRSAGWTVKGVFPHHLQKCVVLVAPHTSNWDFVIGLAFRSKLNLIRARYLGKAELFKPPFGFLFRKLGGFPVNRSEKNKLVGQVVELFNTHDSLVLVLSPEGTRKKVERLRTGFYHIAKKAAVPIVMTGFDFEKKQAIISEPFFATGDEKADFNRIYQFYATIKGKNPEQGMSHFAEIVS
jgi:1-acyl-sn-glycerol-3-phosphate acyltransferase